MSQTIKLQEEELQQIQENQNQTQQLIFNLGQLEVQKVNVITQLRESQEKVNTLAKELQGKYGEGEINLETGEIILAESPKPTE